MFRKIKRNKIIPIIIIIIIIIITCLFIIVNKRRFFSIVNMSNNKTNYFIDVKLKLSDLQQARTHEINLENKYQLTAIILHWKRLPGVQKLIEYYINTKLFKEIIVWNNNPEIDLTLNQLLTDNSSSNLIRIINSKKNLRDEAKYLACAQAQTLACFYVDDDWNISHYTKSLIASFRSDPNLLHSATNVPTYYNNMLWTFMDSQIDLHTGFSWIGSGSIFLRKHAQRHLELLTTHLKTNQSKYFLTIH